MVTCEVAQFAEQGCIIGIHDRGKFGTGHF